MPEFANFDIGPDLHISSDYGMAIRADATGNIYTTGIFQSYVDFDPGSATYIMNGNSHDAFVQKLSQCDITFSNSFSLAGQTFNTDGDYFLPVTEQDIVFCTKIVKQ